MKSPDTDDGGDDDILEAIELVALAAIMSLENQTDKRSESVVNLEGLEVIPEEVEDGDEDQQHDVEGKVTENHVVSFLVLVLIEGLVHFLSDEHGKEVPC